MVKENTMKLRTLLVLLMLLVVSNAHAATSTYRKVDSVSGNVNITDTMQTVLAHLREKLADVKANIDDEQARHDARMADLNAQRTYYRAQINDLKDSTEEE
jgi:cell division protein FtsB